MKDEALDRTLCRNGFGTGYGHIKADNRILTFSNYQLNAQFLYSSTICMLHYDPQHVSSSTCILYGCLQRVTIPEAVVIQFVLLRMSSVLLETC